MDVVLQKAVEKLDKEAEELAKEKPVMKLVGQLLADFVTGHPGTAKFFADAKKSLKGAYNAVEKVAREKEKGGAYCMSDDEFLDLALDYYGIKDCDRKPAAAEKECKSERAEQRVQGDSRKVDVGGLLEGL